MAAELWCLLSPISPPKCVSESELGEDVQTNARNAHQKARLPQPGPQESQSTPEQVNLAETNPLEQTGSLVLSSGGHAEQMRESRPAEGVPNKPTQKRECLI